MESVHKYLTGLLKFHLLPVILVMVSYGSVTAELGNCGLHTTGKLCGVHVPLLCHKVP